MNDQVNPVVVFKRNLTALIEKKELALPTNVNADAFKNAAIVAVQDNPGILGCDEASVFKSIRTLAAAGLIPDGREAALVPFNTREGGQFVKKCQAMPMVFGLIKMARRSGDVADIRAHIVYQNEVDKGLFTYIVGDEEKLEHQPILFGEKGEPVAAYAIARLKDGSVVREFMSAQEIDTVRRAGSSQKVRGDGGKSSVSNTPVGIWKDWWAEMWKKTVIRRICKRLDMSAEDMRRVMVDQDTIETMRDVTPRERGGFAQLAEKARLKPEAAHDGEVLPDEDQPPAAPDYSALDTETAFPGSDEWEAGVKARQDNELLSSCPFEDEEKVINWVGGWKAADAHAGDA